MPSHALGLLHAALVFFASLCFAVLISAFGELHTTQLGMLGVLTGQQIAIVAGLTIVFVTRADFGWRPILGHSQAPVRWLVIVALGAPGLILIQAPLLEWWAAVTNTLEPPWYAIALDLNGPWRSLAVFVAVAVVPPICEELFFRGYLMHRLRTLGNTGAITLQAVIFALYHNDIYGMPIYLITGVILGLIRLRADALWPAIVLHAINNLLGVLDYHRGTSLYEVLGEGAFGIGAALTTVAVVLALRAAQPASGTNV